VDKLQQAIAFHKQSNFSEAERLYQDILAQDPANALALHYLGMALASRQELDEARFLIEKALELEPNNPLLHNNTGIFYANQGDLESAAFHSTKAIELKPDFADAYQNLADISRGKSNRRLLMSINTLLAKQLDTSQQCTLHFAAGKLLDNDHQYDKAFSHYQQGNLLKGAEFDPSSHRKQIVSQLQFFDKQYIALTKHRGLYNKTPIFIVGMPRSGTSLIEQIISNHSDVFGAGELPDIKAISSTLRQASTNQLPYPFYLLETPELRLLEFGLAYIDKINRLSKNSVRVTDKNPLNFHFVGLIRLLFPNAKIIHGQRNPIDTCLSCYFQNFSKGQDYAFNLDHLAEVYFDYQTLMQHWLDVYPDNIYTLHYEQLVAEPERAVPALLNFCGLFWEDSCLSFENNKRHVATASRFQIRQPLYNHAVGRWQPYTKHLQPLIDKLTQLQVI
jgi:tetratricopeptide (TPR) repeat protein